MKLVAAGRANKQIAADLGISEVTVKVHRGQVMRKMRARSLADLVRMADRLGRAAAPPSLYQSRRRRTQSAMAARAARGVRWGLHHLEPQCA